MHLNKSCSTLQASMKAGKTVCHSWTQAISVTAHRHSNSTCCYQASHLRSRAVTMLSCLSHIHVMDFTLQLQVYCNMECKRSIGMMLMFNRPAYLWVAGVEVHCTQCLLWVGIEMCISLHTTQSDTREHQYWNATDLQCSFQIFYLRQTQLSRWQQADEMCFAAWV